MKKEFISVGTIVNAHGIRGEVKLNPVGFDPEFLAEFDRFIIGGKETEVLHARVHKSVVLLTLPGVEDMNAALALKDKVLYIRREDAKLPEGECFDDELLGMEVYDAATGDLLGEIVAVDPYPASKIYTVKGKKEYLIPAVKGAFIRSIDLGKNRMEVHVWEGMATDER